MEPSDEDSRRNNDKERNCGDNTMASDEIVILRKSGKAITHPWSSTGQIKLLVGLDSHLTIVTHGSEVQPNKVGQQKRVA